MTKILREIIGKDSKDIVCRGPSMKPTISMCDKLAIDEYKDKAEIEIGDIIYYPRPDGEINIVHRIIEIKEDGVITRGDNNNKIDPYLIKFKDIQGKVIGLKRKNKIIKLTNGKRGFYIHRFHIIKKSGLNFIFHYPRKLTHYLAENGLFHFLSTKFKTKVLQVNGNKDKKLILVYKGKEIGFYSAAMKKWVLLFPYKIFIATNKLPIPKT
ncbi:MAG: signal peptidase I [Pseudomonadota bacterium]